MMIPGSRPRAVIVGAGGLGGPIAIALASRSALTLRLVDDDVVDLSNLQRQVQFRTVDVGEPKVIALRDALIRRGIDGEGVEAVGQRLRPDNLGALLAGADLVVEGTDDAEIKFAVNDWCQRNSVPYIIAAVGRYGGHVFVGSPGAQQGCYRCLFEAPPPAHEAPSCAGSGVLGAVVGVVGGAAAQLASELLDSQATVEGGLTVFEDLRSSAPPRLVRFASRPECPSCGLSRLPTPPNARPAQL